MFHALASVSVPGLRAPPPPAGGASPDRAQPPTDFANAVAGKDAAGGKVAAGLAERVAVSRATKESDTNRKPRDPEGLSEEQERQVQKLRQRDAEVRAHEQAHAAAGGAHAGGASYEFVTGPDGKRYAVGGEVQIDISPVKDNPAATVRKMETVIRAALAPAEPSSQDQAVAREASKIRSAAQAELQKQREAAVTGKGGTSTGDDPASSAAAAGAASGDGEIVGRLLEASRAYGGAEPASREAGADTDHDREHHGERLCACGAVH